MSNALASTAPSASSPHTEALWPALWASPLPALLQDASFRVVDVNDAFVALTGHPRERITGTDAVLLQPADDRELTRAQRDEWRKLQGEHAAVPAYRRRMLDASGRAHWFQMTTLRLAPPGRQVRWLTLLQDETGAYDAREQARRADEELDQWFDLSGGSMLVYDSTGLILRSNAAFEALVDRVAETLDDSSPELQSLLGWEQGRLSASLQPGARAQERWGVLLMPDGGRKRLSAHLVCRAYETGERRVLAVLRDHSAEDERDQAQMEVGMLMDAARVGVATFDPARGWLASPGAPRHGVADEDLDLADGEGTLLGIRRDLVEPSSQPQFDRLQQALRRREREDVRYAVRHPKLGTRWLMTRVAPVQLTDGRETMSVVTLDITVQETALRRSEQLLRELETILDSSTAGMAYLRGPVLVRCNDRFARMLGFTGGAAAGASLEEILSRSIGPLDGVRDALAALAAGRTFEAELPVMRGDGPAQWYSLSVRRAEAREDGAGEPDEAVAVLTDITRLKSQQAELEQLLRDRELMFSLSEVGIIYQRGARIERANQAMADLTGWAAPELATLDPAELYEDARACVDFEARIQQALRERGRFSGERQLRRRDSRLVWVQVAVRPVDADDEEAGVISSFVDVDERRRARETLAAQAERTRSILNSVLVGIVTVSERGIEWMNRSARRMFAGELADFVGEPISIVATPEPDHPLRRADWLHRLDEGQAETFECRMRGRDGREFWVVGNAVLTGSGAGEAVREVTFALLDIERRRQAEVHIAQAQASLQRVIETAPLAMALFDAQTLRVQQLNQTAMSFFGRPSEQLLGATPEECCPADLAQALRGWLSAVATGGPRRQHEWKQDGEPHRTWECRFVPLEEVGQAPSQLLMVATDVTEQRAAEQARLQAAIDQREVLVREVHHRIKNNLQGVAGLLQQTAARNPDVSRVLGEAVSQVQAIAQVYGLQVGVSGPLAAVSLMQGIASSVQRTFGCVIRSQVLGEVPHELPEAESIPFALVLNELLTNAVKHGKGGELQCELAVVDDGIALRVSGQGQLPEGFDLTRLRAGVAGLGLVRALLPRRTSRFTLTQQGDRVVAQVDLLPPAVRLPAGTDQRQSAA